MADYPYRSAGKSFTGEGGSSKACMDFTNDRPGTPPEISKYRKSSQLQPGQRFQHPGLKDDLDKMNLTDRIYGATSDKGNGTAAELINHKKLSELQRMNLAKKESIYKGAAREPLGRTAVPRDPLPEKFTTGKLPFGRPGKHSIEKAKEVIWPDVSKEQVEGEEIYKRSHNNYGPGEQKKRGYKWYVDPVTTRFGVAGDNIALNGVSKDVAEVLSGAGETESIINTKQVEDFRNMGDTLGKSKNLGQDSAARPWDLAYGKPGASGRVGGWGTAEILKGKYSLKEQQPDIDLGKSITPGFRNISLEDRAYGCPSIRTDLPRGDPMKRSVSDSQNYGDDVPAQDLISPPAFSDMAIDPMAFTESKDKEKMKSLFAKIGVVLDDQVFDALYAEAESRGTITINGFRNVLNNYLEAVEEGKEQSWRLARGIQPGNLGQ